MKILKKFNFFVTGVASDIGFGLVRIIRSSFPNSRIITSDIVMPDAALAIVDSFKMVSRADSAEYSSEIEKICKLESIDFVVPTSEAEIKSFWRNKIPQELKAIGCQTIILPESVVSVCLDKLETSKHLSSNGVKVPITLSLSEYVKNPLVSVGYPLVLKPRSGQGSKDLKVVRDSDQYIHYLQSIDSADYEDFVVQQWLDDSHGEFTCCVYRFGSETRTVIFRRELGLDGGTKNGVVVDDKKIDEYIRTVASCFDFEGGINIQLRIHDGCPVLFEINPRFSSTLVFRHKLGFQDFLWEVMRLSDGVISSFYPVKPGVKFYRGFYEYFEG